MMGYFKPLRRKIGIVVLGLACLFLAQWIRSGVMQDSAAVVVADESSYHLISAHQYLTFVSVRTNFGDRLRSSRFWSEPSQPKGMFIVHYGSILSTLLQPAPFRPYDAGLETVGSGPNAKKTYAHFNLFSVPYWSIVIPLTLLSGWLLLSKPKKVL